MNERKLRRLFPNAPESFIQRNKDNDIDSGGSSKSESMVRLQVENRMDKEALEKRFKLTFVGVEFHADHGIELDEDNRRFIVKPLLDSLVSIGLAKSDKEIKSNVLQRMDKGNADI